MRRRDRGRLLTIALALSGLLLLGVVIALAIFWRSGPKSTQTATGAEPSTHQATTHAPPTQPPPATTAPPTTTAPPPPVQITQLTPFTVTVVWRTPTASTDRLAVALGNQAPTLWSLPSGPASEHSATVGGLAFDSDYHVSVAGETLSFHTPSPSASTVASTGGGTILLDGQPFFPLMVWGACPQDYDAILAAGINLVATNPCSDMASQVQALEGHALSASLAGSADAQDPGVIGWFYPDEADSHRLTASTLPAVPSSSAVGRISFLTLSNHFYSRSVPLAWGRAMYPGLIKRSDVVGFDLYPLQVWCSSARLGEVYDAQFELERLAAGKPTFQWIESGTMDCGSSGPRVTPAVIRAESWLAIAAGAHGLGFFPFQWTPSNGAAVAEITREVKAIAPALLSAPVPMHAALGANVRATAHQLNGAFYVVVVNPTRQPVHTVLSVAGLGTRTLTPLGGGTAVQSHADEVDVSLGPLGAGVYVAAPG